ncbi:MAG: hypothetical protein Q9190_007847 [Brigantiaea leucoxantha]
MSGSQPRQRAPPGKAHGYEFGGPFGAFAISLGLPLVCYLVTFLCNDVAGCPVPSSLQPKSLTFAKLKEESGWPENGILGLMSFRVTSLVLAYYLFSLVLQAALPGVVTQGLPLRSGARLEYKFNGTSFIPTLVRNLADLLSLYFRRGDSHPCRYCLAWFVYIRSFSVKSGNKHKRELAAGGHSGNLVYDWFIGRELNPRVSLPIFGDIDIKIFMELRPGMLGWILLDLAFMSRQYKSYGYVTDSMYLITGFQTLYVLDAIWMEEAILSTMDITTDGFGFMLAFGDLVWLPFVYSWQARYLAVYPVHLGYGGIIGVLAVQSFGYYIFRASNNEKYRFRTDPKDPKVAHLQFMQTKSGSKLLTSGWWGFCRHPNYLGDWIMAWSYCLPTGIAGYLVKHGSPVFMSSGTLVDNEGFISGSPVKRQVVQAEARGWGMVVTYFYLAYFAVLLIHREMRDEEACFRKYGEDWNEYRKRVRWRILPGVY